MISIDGGQAPERRLSEGQPLSCAMVSAHPGDEVYLCQRISIEVPVDGPHRVYPALPRTTYA